MIITKKHLLSMPKILILVLTYTVEPYRSLLMAQRETWDSVDEGINTAFYHGGDQTLQYINPQWPWRQRLMFDCSDAYYVMAGKFRYALEAVWKEDWDMIFRTNSSSYVNKKRLMEFAKTLPTEKLYAGWTMTDTNDDNGLCVSGAGIFFSRDCAEILKNGIDPEKEIEEDVYIGRILRPHGITAIDDRSRIEYPHNPQTWHMAYHTRFKTEDRMRDAENMKLFHRKINGL